MLSSLCNIGPSTNYSRKPKRYSGYLAYFFEDDDIILASDKLNKPQGKVFEKSNLHNYFLTSLLPFFKLLPPVHDRHYSLLTLMFMTISQIKYCHYLRFHLTFINRLSRSPGTQKGASLLVCLYLYSFVCYGRLKNIFVNICLGIQINGFCDLGVVIIFFFSYLFIPQVYNNEA